MFVAKTITREQAETKKTQAANFMDRIGQPDRAEEFEQMSVDEYAEHKGFRLNPSRKRRNDMAGSRAVRPGTTKADLEDQIEEAVDILDDAYAPESSREDLAEALGKALDILRAEEEEEEEEDSADDSDDDDLD